MGQNGQMGPVILGGQLKIKYIGIKLMWLVVGLATHN